MWNPVKSDPTDSIILAHARQSIGKELKRLESKIHRNSDKLKQAHDNNATTRRMATMRTNLSIDCEQRDRLQKALLKIEMIIHG